MKSVPPRLLALGAAALCLVIALAAALAVDSRLDRHWVIRGITLVLAFGCAAVLADDRGRRFRRLVGFIGLLMFGLIIPVTSTTWATPPEIDFALAVADDAKAAVTKDSRGTVTVDDVRAATRARGGALGTLKTDRNPEVRGASAFPLILRAKPTQGRPWACLSFPRGLDARIRPC
jgi:hypothetical protein